jgi:hypothetical protein
MLGIHDFSLFLAAGVLLNLTPGPDTAYICGRSIAQGREAGVASALGICVGSIFHTCAAALGLSAILATSAVAFGAVKLLGGAYLIFLGVKMIFERSGQLSLPSNFRRHTIASAFRQRRFDQCSQSESRALLSCFPSAIHRPEIKHEGLRVSFSRSHIRNDRHNLVSYSRVVRFGF